LIGRVRINVLHASLGSLLLELSAVLRMLESKTKFSQG
jgi:hypothetical protein